MINDYTAKNEAFLQNLFLLENIQGGIVYSDFDPPFCLRYATEGMAKLSGYTVEELLHMGQMDLVHEDDKAALADDVGQQLSVGDFFSVEYRLLRKDGSYVYVLDRAKAVSHEDGNRYIHCLLTDISDLKDTEQALRLSEEKYKIAIQQSGNVILEYSVELGELSFSENYKLLFGCPAPQGNLQEIVQNGWADEAYQSKLLALFDSVVKTATTSSMELLVHTGPIKSVWCSLYLIPIVDKGHLYSVVGCLENIDKEKNVLEHLTELSQKDGLTGIYNRHAVEEFVNAQMCHLPKKEPSALLILDIDYFKQINDSRGHAYGDEVLVRLSLAVNALLPPNAILGRLGGDEFLVFASFPQGKAGLKKLAEDVVQGVKAAFENGGTPISISIGAAWRTASCGTFQKLYANADIALYKTKESGRDGYTIFAE